MEPQPGYHSIEFTFTEQGLSSKQASRRASGQNQAHPKEVGARQGEVRIQGELKEQAGTEGVKGHLLNKLEHRPF